ncbi:uncharacterized protein PG986_004248 [Apiospora aurea]|uniref:F-box domain-containing protein n=1 Tax=Apiospora aurea TaxID=335848 RepID=A0ABR1QNM0_9PEZI
MPAYHPELPKGGLTILPNELILQLAHHMSTRSLRSLSVTSKRYHSLLDQKVLFEEEVEDERLFDEARSRFSKLMRVYGLSLSVGNIAAWPATKVAPAYRPLNDDDHAFLNACVSRWGKGILYLAIGSDNELCRMLRNWNSILELPVSLFRGALILRAIKKCPDIKVIEQVIKAYLKKYPAAIQGPKEYHSRTSLNFNGDFYVPPVLWACSHNRSDVLEILHTKNNEKGKEAEQKVDFDIILDQMSTQVISGVTDNQGTALDAWQVAFYGLSRARVARTWSSNPGMREDACVWLLEKNLGFSSRSGGISIDYLFEAAAFKKARLVRALIAYFKGRLASDDFQGTLTLALHHATGGYYNPQDGHEEIIDILIGAGTSIPPREDPPLYLDRGLPGASLQLRQSPARPEDAGLLARAVRFAPRNAVYLLQLQMEQNMTDYRDLKAALSEALLLGDELKHGRAPRLEFFKMVFPDHVHLAYSPAELRFFKTLFPENVGLEYRPAELESARERFRAYENLVDVFIEQMGNGCLETQSHDVAMHVVQVVGRARVGERLLEDLEYARSEFYSSVWNSG